VHIFIALLLVFGVGVCLEQAVRGLRTGRLWVDLDIDGAVFDGAVFDGAVFDAANVVDDRATESHPLLLAGRPARALAIVYLLTAVGCVAALVDMWSTR